MATKTYSEKLRDPRWQKKRLQILDRDGFMCKYCGDTDTTLHVHHERYTCYLPHEEPDENLITCCEHCHSIVEYAKKQNVPIYQIIKIKDRADEGYIATVITTSGSVNFFKVSDSNISLVFGLTEREFSYINLMLNRMMKKKDGTV